VRQQVAQHGKTQTGFTPVATSAHCVTDVAAAVAFYSQVLGMKVVLDETLGRAETNRFLARPADARTHTVFVAGSHFYGKIALNEPQNFFVPERVALAHAPRVGYLAQGFRVDDLDAAAQRFQQRFPGVPCARIDWPKLPEWPACEALRVSIPGSGAMAFLLGPACA
jgi:catechol 2,3-dioxygenase-like lactoylglutathione lyase family enzyme